jgi:L-amino acid N-acyltransferase YncA
MSITISPMNEQDWPEVSKIYKQGIDTGKATFQTCIPEYSDWDASHIKECRFVALNHNAIVGWVALSKVSNRCVYGGVAEVSIYIAETSRGKGIGKALLNYLVTESEKAGLWMLQSGIMEDNPASIRLHEKCGFRKVGLRDRIGKDCNGKWRSTVLMERRSKTVGVD